MVVGDDESVLVVVGADERGAECVVVGQVADCVAFFGGYVL